jgi:hypothetical protein
MDDVQNTSEALLQSNFGRITGGLVSIGLDAGLIPYILESNPHHFYSFRGLKNQMRIRFAVESWILKTMIEPL